jgi:hypothetical protein
MTIYEFVLKHPNSVIEIRHNNGKLIIKRGLYLKDWLNLSLKYPQYVRNSTIVKVEPVNFGYVLNFGLKCF